MKARMRRVALLVGCLALVGCGEQGVGLSNEQAQAVESVTRLTKYFGSVTDSFSGITSLSNLLPNLLGGTTGSCPTIRLRPQGVGVAADFDYTGGCSALPLAAGRPVGGVLSLGLDLLQLQGNIGFNGFNLAGHNVTGGIGVKPFDQRLNRLRLTLQHLQIQDIGLLDGSSAVEFGAAGRLAMQDGELQMRDIAGSDFGVKLANLAIDPARWGNPMPEAGQISFLVPVKLLGVNTVELRCLFDQDTPREGKVNLYVGPLGPITYRLKHFGAD